MTDIEGQPLPTVDTTPSLNQLLADPAVIMQLPELHTPNDALTQAEWDMTTSILKLALSKIQRTIDEEKTRHDKVLSLDVEVDNGVVFSYEHRKDPALMTILYVSSHGTIPSDWGKKLTIAPEKVHSRSFKFMTKKRVADEMYTTSQFILKTTRNLKYIEGNPAHTQALRAHGLLTNNNTSLYHTNTKHQTCAIERDNKEEQKAERMPLILDPTQMWQTVHDADNLDAFAQDLYSSLHHEDREKTTEDVMLTLISNVSNLVPGACATIRMTPVTINYLKDLFENLLNSRPCEMTYMHLPYDPIGIGRKKLLEKQGGRN